MSAPWMSKVPALLNVQTAQRMSPVPARRFHVPSFWNTRPLNASLVAPPLRFIVAAAMTRSVPVPTMFPAVQLDAGLEPVTVNVELPASVPAVISSCAAEPGASNAAVPPASSVFVVVQVPLELTCPPWIRAVPPVTFEAAARSCVPLVKDNLPVAV